MTRICVFGCKSTTRFLINALSEYSNVSAVITINPDMGNRSQVADYDDLTDVSESVEVYTAERYDLKSDRDTQFFRENKFDVGFVAGWQRLVPEAVLKTFNIGVFGMHGSSQDLPKGRGRSPMNWSIIEGRRWFYTNLFMYSPGVDDGPIVDTMCFSINNLDTAETLHMKNILAMGHIIETNFTKIISNSFSTKEQTTEGATYYPKRTTEDGLIDWRDDIFVVDALIRAVAPPFSGAFSNLDGTRINILRAAIFYTDLEHHAFQSEAVGTICAVFPNGKFLVRCNGGVLIVHECLNSSSLENILRQTKFEDMDRDPARFPRNHYGYFDMPTN